MLLHNNNKKSCEFLGFEPRLADCLCLSLHRHDGNFVLVYVFRMKKI